MATVEPEHKDNDKNDNITIYENKGNVLLPEIAYVSLSMM